MKLGFSAPLNATSFEIMVEVLQLRHTVVSVSLSLNLCGPACDEFTSPDVAFGFIPSLFVRFVDLNYVLEFVEEQSAFYLVANAACFRLQF